MTKFKDIYHTDRSFMQLLTFSMLNFTRRHYEILTLFLFSQKNRFFLRCGHKTCYGEVYDNEKAKAYFLATIRKKLASICMQLNLSSEVVCVEVLRPSQPNGVMSSAVSLPNHTFTGQA